jgi:hypothetical protein
MSYSSGIFNFGDKFVTEIKFKFKLEFKLGKGENKIK